MVNNYSFNKMIELAKPILDDGWNVQYVNNEFEKKYNKYTEVE